MRIHHLATPLVKVFWLNQFDQPPLLGLRLDQEAAPNAYLLLFTPMFTYIKGKIAHKTRTELVIEVNGLGYLIQISLQTYQAIAQAEQALLFLHLVIREDAWTLYGFSTIEERQMFEQLISVSGVGPSTARMLLSTLSPLELRQAIVAENVQILRNAKGIGAKSAKRIIVELKDLILRDSGAASEAMAQTLGQETSGGDAAQVLREEAMAALIALGFNKIQVQKTLNSLLREKPELADSGQLIKLALTALT